MYQVEDEPIETIHLYVVREDDQQTPPVWLALTSLIILLCLSVAVGVLYHPPLLRETIRVPAILLPLRSFSAQVAVIPTGVKTYPATSAHGTLTITNGSILSEELPKGLILTGKDGVEVATDTAVFVPAGSATGYGVAYVSAHTTVSGKSGNIPADDINSVEGSSIYIRNLEAFTGGKDAHSVTFATQQDRVRAIDQARAIVAAQVTGLHYPCRETIATTLIWHCQFVTYSVPSYMHVLSVQLQGNVLLVAVWFVVHPRRVWVK